MKRNLFLILIFFMISKNESHAQNRLIELKLGVSSLSTIDAYSDGSYNCLGFMAEGHYYIKPKIAIGAFYSRSFDSFDLGESFMGSTPFYLSGSCKFLSYGVSGKISTNRTRLFQGYLLTRLYQRQNVYDFEDEFGFSVGDKGVAGSIGVGIVLKVSRTIGINLLEVNYNSFLSGMEFTRKTFSSAEYEVKSGLIFNLKERK